MPPKITPRGGGRGGGDGGRGGGPGRGGPPRGGPPGRGGGPGRGGAPPRGGAPTGPAIAGVVHSGPDMGNVAAHIETIGVRRPGTGSAGKKVMVTTNNFPCEIPDKTVSHYDVAISPDNLPLKANYDIIEKLQTKTAPQIFHKRVVYDGRKNIFAIEDIPFENGGDQQEFVIPASDAAPAAGRAPKVYRVKITKVATINLEMVHRFVQGKQSMDNTILTGITALNVVIRMTPMTQKYPFNIRSFFTRNEVKNIGGGMELWRGYFQSVRPGQNSMHVNVDISTGVMYKSGPLIDVCLDFFERGKDSTPQMLFAPPHGKIPDRERLRLARFLLNVRVYTTHRDKPGQKSPPKTIKGLSKVAASDHKFAAADGKFVTVADYFKQTYNKSLKYPKMLMAVIGKDSLVPLELLHVEEGQIMRKQVPPEKTRDVLEFSTKKPQERLQSIMSGVTSVLAYGQSEYMRQFGLSVDTTGPMQIPARILPVPTLQYGNRATVTPANGTWNMTSKKFYEPAPVKGWVLIIYERQQRFNEGAVTELINGLGKATAEVGMGQLGQNPIVKWENGQGNISAQLRAAGGELKQQQGIIPSLMVVVLPEGATDLYVKIKHFGDCEMGVATQCLKSSKCFRAKPQYWANVCLKINVKLGGINTIPDARSVPFLNDPANPTVVMGADAMHPPPGTQGRPSFTALVGNVDSDTSKYIATTKAQASRQEIIDDLEDMVAYVLTNYMQYRKFKEKKANPQPKRIVFFRDGVSEGQFRTVLESEVPLIKQACQRLEITPIPKLTVIVVGKRHHVRFFPKTDSDKSGNCPAGTVVDTGVVHPTEFDFYLQSHSGLLGTSRPAHYSVLLDENNMKTDMVQQLSFALCHVYARATRSVSIPAPVYYADIVCARAKNHYATDQDFTDTQTVEESDTAAKAKLEQYKQNFKPPHQNIAKTMYFS